MLREKKMGLKGHILMGFKQENLMLRFTIWMDVVLGVQYQLKIVPVQ